MYKKYIILLAAIFSLVFIYGCNGANTQFWDYALTVKAQDNTTTPTGFHVLTVPSGKKLVITDVVMTHNIITTSGTFRANIRRGPATNGSACKTASLVLGPYVNPKETVSLNLSTGIVFNSGDQLCIAIGGTGGPTEGVTFAFSGYYLDS